MLFVAGAGFIASLLFSVVVFLELIEQPFALLDNEMVEEAVDILTRKLPERVVVK